MEFTIIIYVVLIVSAIWMAWESASFGYDKNDIKGLGAMGPVGWFFSGLFLWIIAFPLYLGTRGELKKAGAKSRAPVTAESMYTQAVDLHYSKKDPSAALVLYSQVVARYEGSTEALNAQSQIENITSGNAPPPMAK